MLEHLEEEIKAIGAKKIELEKAFNQLNPLEFFVGGYKAAGGTDLPMERTDVVKIKTLLQEFYNSIHQAEHAIRDQMRKEAPGKEALKEKAPAKMEVKKSSTPKKK